MERRKPGKDRIEQALMELLQITPLRDIKVVDLCGAAHVSRSTFYMHFSNVVDVYRRCVKNLISNTATVRSQIRCSDCAEDASRLPLCHMVRENEAYSGVINDERFLSTFLEVCYIEFHELSAGPYEDACPQKEIASALQFFQFAGCILTAKTVPVSTDWAPIKQALDSFIRGGLDEIRKKNIVK